MRIGILTAGHVPEDLTGQFGKYPEMFARLLDGHGFEFCDWAVVDMDFPASLSDADGWLITGSRHGAYEDLPFIAPLESFIRDAYAQSVPMVGICFGHQIIAQALGGKVEKFHKGWAIGAKTYDFSDESMMLNAWHQDQVVVPPESAKVIASNDFCEYAALVYGDRAFTVQPHPEIRDDYLQGLITTRGPGLVPDEILKAATENLGGQLDDGRFANRIAAFFKQPREKPAHLETEGTSYV